MTLKQQDRPGSEAFFEPDPEAPAVGRWFWVHPKGRPQEDAAVVATVGRTQEDTSDADTGDEDEDRDRPWLGCITHIGSNYAEVTAVNESYQRIHLDEFKKHCAPAPNADSYIIQHIAALQTEVSNLLGQVQELTRRLAVSPTPQAADGSQHALVIHDKGEAIGRYKGALIKAKEKTLPDLFKRIEEKNQQMGKWMQASLIPMKAQAAGMKDSIKLIEARIFNVELYAGLTEQVELVKDGKPAALETPIHLFQRRHYMDEECLAQYEAGGMAFKDIDAFDSWLAKPKNLQRILPHARSMVAFRVRRYEKERRATSLQQFIRFMFEAQSDKLTFLYIRNGEQLYRLSTAIDFGEQLFPDFDNSQLTGKLYGKLFATRVERLITEGAYLDMVKREDEELAARDAKYEADVAAFPAKMAEYKAKLQAWKEARRKADADEPLSEEERRLLMVREPSEPSSPWKHYFRRESEDYEAFEPGNVHYDDMRAFLQRQLDEHNRLVLVLQGLLDRSPVLHPHPPWRIFEPSGFRAALRLVYDDARALPNGEAPDFEAYRGRLNAQLKPGCVTVGQQFAWLRREAEKENDRRARNAWRQAHDWELETFKPYGNDGPGTLARVEKVRRDGTCYFSWWRDRLRNPNRRQRAQGNVGDIRCHLQCPITVLLNVSAYKPGDFHQFYDDPRTRADYLKWAPLLLIAEDFHAGKRGVENEKGGDSDDRDE